MQPLSSTLTSDYFVENVGPNEFVAVHFGACTTIENLPLGHLLKIPTLGDCIPNGREMWRADMMLHFWDCRKKSSFPHRSWPAWASTSTPITRHSLFSFAPLWRQHNLMLLTNNCAHIPPTWAPPCFVLTETQQACNEVHWLRCSAPQVDWCHFDMTEASENLPSLDAVFNNQTLLGVVVRAEVCSAWRWTQVAQAIHAQEVLFHVFGIGVPSSKDLYCVVQIDK